MNPGSEIKFEMKMGERKHGYLAWWFDISSRDLHLCYILKIGNKSPLECLCEALEVFDKEMKTTHA